MNNTLVIQPVQHNVMEPLPYPWFVGENMRVQRQDYWKGDPLSLVGFAPKDKQEIAVTAKELFDDKDKIAKCKKLYPVFCKKGGGFYTVTRKCDLHFMSEDKQKARKTKKGIKS